MTKHLFAVSGLDAQGKKFTGSCVADDIVKAINLFRAEHYSPHKVEQNRQMPADHPECITCLNGQAVSFVIARGNLSDAEKRAMIYDHFKGEEENHE